MLCCDILSKFCSVKFICLNNCTYSLHGYTPTYLVELSRKLENIESKVSKMAQLSTDSDKGNNYAYLYCLFTV